MWSSGRNSLENSTGEFLSSSPPTPLTGLPSLSVGTQEGKTMDAIEGRQKKGRRESKKTNVRGGGRRSLAVDGGRLERGEALLESFARELYITVERKTMIGRGAVGEEKEVGKEEEEEEEERGGGGGKARRRLKKNGGRAPRYMFYHAGRSGWEKTASMDGGGGRGGWTEDTRALRLEKELGLAFDLTRVDIPSSSPSFLLPPSFPGADGRTMSGDGENSTSVVSPFPTYEDPIVVRLWHSHRPYSRHHKGKEIGRAILSLRGLLSERIYPRCASVTLPLVSVTERSNRAGVAFVGYIQLVVAPSSFLPLPPSIPLRAPSLISESFRRFCRSGGGGVVHTTPKMKRGGNANGNTISPDRRPMRMRMTSLSEGANREKTVAEEEEKKRAKNGGPPLFFPLDLQNMSNQEEEASGGNALQIGDEARWYFNLLWQFGEDYDPGLLLDLHYLVFEVFLQQPGWPRNVEKYLYQLARPWGE